MAKDVDKQVVEIEFDNSKFDKNVKKSSSRLDEFKAKLSFEDAAKSMDVVAKKLKMLDMVTFSVINNLTTRVLNLGVQLVKSLSVNNIAAGWDKFSNKTIATATIMAQSVKVAGKELTDYAEKTEAVNEQLEKLLWFTDETSYNFTDMVESIGKFTAAGVDLDVAAKAMQGIATWAAKSGQSAATASRAMAQLAQTLGKGYVQLMDWRSIQNANMDTQEFRQTVLETAEAIGELRKQGNEYITKTGKKITAKNFTDTLSEKWFTSDVLTKTLSKYSAAVDEIYKLAEQTGETAYDIIEEFGADLDPFGVAAFKAAQECRTLSDAINSIKDAVSTGWMTTFELFIGQYDDAKKVWSGLADALYDAFVESNNFRNSMLKVWKDLDGNKDLFGEHGDDNQGAFWNIYDSIIAIKNTVSAAWDAIFPKTAFIETSEKAQDLGNRFKSLTGRIQEFTRNLLKNIQNDRALQGALKGIFSILKLIVAVGQGIYVAFEPIITVIKGVVYDLFDRIGIFGDRLSRNQKVVEKIQSVSEGIASVLRTITEFLDIRGNINRFLDFISSIFNGTFNGAAVAEGFKTFFTNIGDAFTNLTNKIKAAGGIPGILNKMLDGIKSFINKVKSLFSSTTPEEEIEQVTGGGAMKMMNAPLKSATQGVVTTVNSIGEIARLVQSMKKVFLKVADVGASVLDLIEATLDVIKMVIDNVTDILKQISKFDIKQSVEWLKENWLDVALWTGLIMLLLHARTLWYDIIYAVRGLEYAAAELADSFWEWAKSKYVAAIADAIKYAGVTMLAMAASVAILTPVLDKSNKGLYGLTLLMGVFAVTMAGLMAATLAMAKTNSKFTADLKELKFGSEGNNSVYAVAGMIRAFGIAMLAVSLAMKNIASISDESGWNKALGIFIAMSGVMIVTTGLMIAVAAVTKKGSKVVAPAYPGLFAMIGFAVALWSFGNTLVKFAYAQKELGAGIVWSAIGMMATTIILLGVLIGVIAVTGKRSMTLGKTVKSLSTLVLSLMPFSWAVQSLASMEVADMWRGAGALYALLGVLTAMLLVINLTNKANKETQRIGSSPHRSIQALALLSLSFIPLVGAIVMLSGALKGNNIWSTIGAVVLLAAFISAELVMAGVMNKLAKDAKGSIAKNILALTALNISLIGFVLALRLMTAFSSDLEKIAACVGLLIPVLLAYSLIIYALGSLNDSGGTAKVVVTMITSAILLGGFIAACHTLTKFDIPHLITIMGGLTAFMLSFGGVMLMISAAAKKVGSLKTTIAPLIMMSLAIVSFGGSMMMLSNTNWSTIIVGAASFAIALFSIVGALALFKAANIEPKTLADFGLALVTIGAGVLVLLGVLQLMGEMNMLEMAVGFIAICGGIALLAVIAKFLGPAATSLIQLGLGLAIISASLLITAVALNVFAQALGPIGDNITVIGELITTTLTSILEWINGNLSLILEAVTNIITVICEAIITSADTIMSAIVTLIVKLAEHIGEIKDPIISIINSIFDIIDAFLPRLLKTLTILVDGVINFLRTETPKFVKWLSETITVVLSEIRDNIRNWAEMFFDIVWGIVSVFATKFLGAIPSIVNYLFDFVKTVLDSLGDALVRRGKEMGVTFVRFGKNLMKGLWNGMMGGLGELVKDIPIIGGALESFFKETLQIHSPSRMTAEMGVYLMQGFGVGMKEELNNTRKDTTETIASCMTTALHDAYDIINKEDDEMVIRPVVDLSGVRSGAGSISSMLSSINGQSISLSSSLARNAVGSSSSKDSGGTQNITNVNEEGDTYNVTFNVTSDDPEALAEETDAALQKLRMKRAMAKGGV